MLRKGDYCERKMEDRACMSPGGWTAEVISSEADQEVSVSASAVEGKTGSAAGMFTVTGTPARLSEAQREAVLAQLRKRPLTLYALLRGGPASEELAGLLPAAQAPEGSPGAATASAAVACTCGRPGCAHAAAAERAGRRAPRGRAAAAAGARRPAARSAARRRAGGMGGGTRP